MGSIISRLDDKGRAFVDVVITPSSFFQVAIGKEKFAGLPGDQFGVGAKFKYKCKALIDTGASVSSIDSDVAEKLGLVTKGAVPVNSPTGQNDHNAYDVDLFVCMGETYIWIDNRIVISSNIKKQGIHMLIGTDILKLGRLVFEKGETFSLTIPA
jgi:predicted aspartyl protease